MRSDSEFLANVKSKHEKALAERRDRRKRVTYTVSALFAFAVISAAVIPVVTHYGDMKSYSSNESQTDADRNYGLDDQSESAVNTENEVGRELLPNESDGALKSGEADECLIKIYDPEKITASNEKLTYVGTLGEEVEIYSVSTGEYVFCEDGEYYYCAIYDLDTAIEKYKKYKGMTN